VHRVDCGIVTSYDLDAYASKNGDVVMAETQRYIGMEIQRKEINEPEEEKEEDHEKEIEVAVPTFKRGS
jgi:hypothetical protein